MRASIHPRRTLGCATRGIGGVAVVLAIGCPGPDWYAQSDDETSLDDAIPAGATSGSSREGAESSDGSSSDAVDDEGGGFLDSPDAPLAQCSVHAQDCPAGHKCNVWAADGTGLNGSRCVPIAPSTVGRGETCMVVPDAMTGSMLTGIDNCELGAVCWDPDPVTARGMCVDFCSINGDCKHPHDNCFGKSAMLCFPRCHPLEQDCPTGCACYGTSAEFSCLPNASGEGGWYGDHCEFVNVCEVGHFCAPAAGVPGCQGSTGCCSPYCDLAQSIPCPGAAQGQACLPWFQEGHAPPGYEDVGVCVIPN